MEIFTWRFALLIYNKLRCEYWSQYFKFSDKSGQLHRSKTPTKFLPMSCWLKEPLQKLQAQAGGWKNRCLPLHLPGQLRAWQPRWESNCRLKTRKASGRQSDTVTPLTLRASLDSWRPNWASGSGTTKTSLPCVCQTGTTDVLLFSSLALSIMNDFAQQ